MNKILIIEDEEAIAELEKDYLELSGFTVEIENRGDEGLKKALEGDVHSGPDAAGNGRLRDLQADQTGEEYAGDSGLGKEGRYR